MTTTPETPAHPSTPLAHLEDIGAATPTDTLVYDTLNALHREEQAIKDRISALKDDLRASMASRGMQAIVNSDGKVIARISEVHTPRLDAKRLKAEHPELAKEYVIVTSTTRFSVTWEEEPAAAAS